jgi:hypothetical protein
MLDAQNKITEHLDSAKRAIDVGDYETGRMEILAALNLMAVDHNKIKRKLRNQCNSQTQSARNT